METTLERLLDITGTQDAPGPLRKLATVKALPAVEKFRTAKLVAEINGHLRPFAEARNSLIDKYGEPVNEKRPNGERRVAPESPKWEEFIDELRPLMQEKVTINSPKVRIPGDLESDEIDAMMLVDLDGFVEVK